MLIVEERGLSEFNAWSGAVETQERILEAGLEEEFERLIDDCYPEGITSTQLNDILWFDSEWVYEALGMTEEEDEEDEDEED